jgi:hypothetical protein
VVRDDERSIRGCPLGDLDLGRHELNRKRAASLPQWLFGQAVDCSRADSIVGLVQAVTFGDGFC